METMEENLKLLKAADWLWWPLPVFLVFTVVETSPKQMSH